MEVRCLRECEVECRIGIVSTHKIQWLFVHSSRYPSTTLTSGSLRLQSTFVHSLGHEQWRSSGITVSTSRIGSQPHRLMLIVAAKRNEPSWRVPGLRRIMSREHAESVVKATYSLQRGEWSQRSTIAMVRCMKTNLRQRLRTTQRRVVHQQPRLIFIHLVLEQANTLSFNALLHILNPKEHPDRSIPHLLDGLATCRCPPFA